MTAAIVVLALASLGMAITGWRDFFGDRRDRGLILVGSAVVLGVICFLL